MHPLLVLSQCCTKGFPRFSCPCWAVLPCKIIGTWCFSMIHSHVCCFYVKREILKIFWIICVFGEKRFSCDGIFLFIAGIWFLIRDIECWCLQGILREIWSVREGIEFLCLCWKDDEEHGRPIPHLNTEKSSVTSLLLCSFFMQFLFQVFEFYCLCLRVFRPGLVP